MDNDVIAKHFAIVEKFYPGLNLTQLGIVTALLGVLRCSMGHENAYSVLKDYISWDNLSPDVQQCLDFIQREILTKKKSKIDIDYWKKCGKGTLRPE